MPEKLGLWFSLNCRKYWKYSSPRSGIFKTHSLDFWSGHWTYNIIKTWFKQIYTSYCRNMYGLMPVLYTKRPQKKIFSDCICIFFTGLNGFLHTHISLISVHIACISCWLEVSCEASAGWALMHLATYTGHIHTDLGFSVWWTVNSHIHATSRIHICTDIDWYRQISSWTCFRNWIQSTLFTAMLVQWSGLLHGTSRSWDRIRVLMREFWILRSGQACLFCDQISNHFSSFENKVFCPQNEVFG